MDLIKVNNAIISDKIYIKEEDIPNILEFQAAFTYMIKKELLYMYTYENGVYSVPSNSYYKLDIDNYDDQRISVPMSTTYTSNATLRLDQQDVVDAFFQIKNRVRSGLIQAPCGWGKTFATIPLILRANQKTLIIVHTKLLFNQWIKEFKKQVPSIKLGEIGAGKYTLGDVTIGLYKSVANRIDKIKDLFGLCIVDEAHRSPANLFSQTVNNINCKYKIAITATPRRKDGKHIVLKDYFTAFKIIAEDALTKETPHYSIIRAPYEFKIKHPKLDWAKELNRLAENRPYLDLIAAWANYDIKQNRAILIVSDRLQMLKVLKTIIPKSILLVGDTDDDDRDEILGQVGTEISAILSTSIFDEGVSCHRLDTMYFTCPSNNDVKWEQRIGRIQREHIDKQYPLIRDFWLKGIIVARQQANRLSWYEQRRFILDEENPI